MAACGATGSIFNVQRFCINDGPGIRTTLFFKGCPLHCAWCHNPEGISFQPEVVFDQRRCLRCGACRDACPRGAADLLGNECRGCGRCAQACPTGARRALGREWCVEDVRDTILKDRIFYESSGGGVTFSGGEPLAQAEFLLACLRLCRAEGIHSAIDTSGCCGAGHLLAAAELTDLVLFDLKILDPEAHQRLLGAPLGPIIQNLANLHQAGCRIQLRVPIVPGVTDSEQNLASLRTLAADLPKIERVWLLPYHETGTLKHHRIKPDRKRGHPLADTEPPSASRLAEVASALSGVPQEVVIGGRP